jgi:hypothetical protein
MAEHRLLVVSESHLLLSDEGEGQTTAIAVGSEAWYQWLTAEQHQSFAFRHALGAFTMRPERKRQGWYWYAYRKQEGKLRKAYLGKAEELTLARLNQVAAMLVSRGDSADVEVDALAESPLAYPADSFAARQPFHQPLALIAGQVTEGACASHESDISPRYPVALPVYLTSLIGREQETQAVCALLRQPSVRLVSLTGTGGCGKTRLAVHVEASSDFEDGGHFVSLARIPDPELVVPTIAQALDVREQASRPLLDKQLLLLPDNFQQIISAAPVVVELLMVAPALKVLVTSQASLQLSEEHEFDVPPLSLPDLWDLPPLDRLAQFEAVRLFVERAVDVLEGVASFLDKSLLRQTEQEGGKPRLSKLETILEYGLECLLANGELEVTQQAHAAYYLALAQEAEPHLTHAVGIRRRSRNRRNLAEGTGPHLTGAEQVVWLERLEREYENLRAALQWSAAHGNEEMELALRLSSGLLAFWTWVQTPEKYKTGVLVFSALPILIIPTARVCVRSLPRY